MFESVALFERGGLPVEDVGYAVVVAVDQDLHRQLQSGAGIVEHDPCTGAGISEEQQLFVVHVHSGLFRLGPVVDPGENHHSFGFRRAFDPVHHLPDSSLRRLLDQGSGEEDPGCQQCDQYAPYHCLSFFEIGCLL